MHQRGLVLRVISVYIYIYFKRGLSLEFSQGMEAKVVFDD